LRIWRVFPRSGHEPSAEGGSLWAPRAFQGDGRHDNPALYGVLYATEEPVAAVVEALAPFRGSGPLLPALLQRAGMPLALAEIDVDEGLLLVDLDDPSVLLREGLCPSVVATRRREITQAQASGLFASHPEAKGLRWWSTHEASWAELSLFAERSIGLLQERSVVELAVGQAVVEEAAAALGL
jgi:hypothetical protein